MPPRGYKLTRENLAKMIAGRKAKTPPFEQRFWSKVNKSAPNGCWEFTAHIGGRGYGTIWDGKKVRTCHQISWELTRGERPAGMCIDHICRNRKCVNPDHLRMVTPKQNAIENNDNPFMHNHNKTHCKHGHPFVPENIFHRPIRGPKGTPMVTRDCIMCRRRRTPGTRLQPNTREEAMALALAKFPRASTGSSPFRD